MKKQKGFVGPLGDDIPSIFPIVIGITLFFAGFSFGVDRYNARTDLLQLRETGLQVAYNVLERGFVESDSAKTPSLEELCTKAKEVASKNRMFIALSIQDNTFYSDTGTNSGAKGIFLSSDPFQNYANGLTKCVSSEWANAFLNNAIPGKDYITYTYPIAVPCTVGCKTYQSGIINIVMWKESPPPVQFQLIQPGNCRVLGDTLDPIKDKPIARPIC